MTAPDLRIGPPRRWSIAVDGVVWLPRLIDKARAAHAGTLGNYLYGQSPVDDAFLRKADIDYAAFSAIVRAASDDAAVLAGIERATPGATERLRAWSVKFPAKSKLFLAVIDFDDDSKATGLHGMLRAFGNVLFVPLLAYLRRKRPTPQ